MVIIQPSPRAHLDDHFTNFALFFAPGAFSGLGLASDESVCVFALSFLSEFEYHLVGLLIK